MILGIDTIIKSSHRNRVSPASRSRKIFSLIHPPTPSAIGPVSSGLFKLSYPSLDCVSIGPTIHHAHSPQELLEIDTVAPFYQWLHVLAGRSDRASVVGWINPKKLG
ncbi:MAG: hypothetical protein P4L81_00460, partial [Candidatus Pacebacteria bacterium]|nr:hypothetical protein [Candidatus Paceibacterota bacterium]